MRRCKREFAKDSPDLIGPNALSPDRMSAEERLAEICGILAAGFVRLQARQSSRLSADRENSFVDFGADRSGHGIELNPAETLR